MNAGRLQITYELLAAILRLPEGASIAAIVPQTAEEVIDRKVSLLLTGDCLPKHGEGQAIQNVRIVYETNGRSFFDH